MGHHWEKQQQDFFFFLMVLDGMRVGGGRMVADCRLINEVSNNSGRNPMRTSIGLSVTHGGLAFDGVTKCFSSADIPFAS